MKMQTWRRGLVLLLPFLLAGLFASTVYGGRGGSSGAGCPPESCPRQGFVSAFRRNRMERGFGESPGYHRGPSLH